MKETKPITPMTVRPLRVIGGLALVMTVSVVLLIAGMWAFTAIECGGLVVNGVCYFIPTAAIHGSMGLLSVDMSSNGIELCQSLNAVIAAFAMLTVLI